ncbi:predicted protein [Sclerotinia sclerotiorum 1980 UF-70]|uniref:Uncharacterized protein n=1 Tax=Sclerotinia sclerotiorum (strain ATCC 18683 / 1980 / Ss-1) TaxID=665079 RepID=A7EZK0_SCLS1|nr:predicted protein [Sclerotinia sclerotiorum 1980 UF-70]EDN94892.1 predicted protein [Sclerotinia sclerotiorum 1980 UF-70]
MRWQKLAIKQATIDRARCYQVTNCYKLSELAVDGLRIDRAGHWQPKNCRNLLLAKYELPELVINKKLAVGKVQFGRNPPLTSPLEGSDNFPTTAELKFGRIDEGMLSSKSILYGIEISKQSETLRMSVDRR